MRSFVIGWIGWVAFAACGGAAVRGAEEPAGPVETEPAGEAVVATPDPAQLDEIDAEFEAKQKMVVRCYVEALESGQVVKGSRGKVLLTMVVSADGHARDVKVVSDTLGSADVARCVVARVLAWDLPAPGADVAFTYQYSFDP